MTKTSFLIIAAALITTSCAKKTFSSTQKVSVSEDAFEKKESDETPEVSPSEPDEPTPEASDAKINGPKSLTVSEQDGMAELNFELSESQNHPIRFSIEVSSGKALEGQDFLRPRFPSVTVKPGRTNFSVEIPILNDDLWDVTDEDFTVRLVSATMSSETTITIQDDEPSPSVSLRDSFFQNPVGTQPNAVIFDHAPDQDVLISLRSDRNPAEAQLNMCGTDTTTAHIAVPDQHYRPVPLTEVQLSSFEFESAEFDTTWLPLPGSTKRFTICFHVTSIIAK